MKKLLLAAGVMFVSLSLFAAKTKKDNVSMFPQAKEGFSRYVIEVPKVENPYDHKVELLIAKKMMVDCNNQAFFGKLNVVNLDGWGYTYLEVEKIDGGVTTMMACTNPPEEKFVTLRASTETLRRYNSRLPLVVYVPKGFEVKYRIWSASQTLKSAIET